jgi:diguanylate cyclase (GGDEF)-like protein
MLNGSRNKESGDGRTMSSRSAVRGVDRRARVYLLGMAFGIPHIAIRWFTDGGADPFVRYAYLPLAAYLLTVSWLLIRRPGSVRAVERCTFALVTALWLGRMAVVLLTGDPQAGWEQLTPWTFMTLPLMAVLGYIFFDTRTAAHWGSLIPATSTALGVAALLPVALRTGNWTYLVQLSRYETYLIVTMVFVHAFALGKDRAAAAQLETERLRTMAHHDPLTGLPNRRRLHEVLARQMAAADRQGQALAIVCFDLDHFKDVNDTHGHAAGDLVLREMAAAVSQAVRPTDIVGRWGGEEFLVVAPDADQADATALAERLRAAIAAHDFPHDIRMTASFGVSEYEPGTGVEVLLGRADELLYAAKASGRDTVRGEPTTDLAANAERAG